MLKQLSRYTFIVIALSLSCLSAHNMPTISNVADDKEYEALTLLITQSANSPTQLNKLKDLLNTHLSYLKSFRDSIVRNYYTL